MNKSISYGLITILFLATFSVAQFPKIKLPKLNAPETPKAGKEIGNKTGTSGGKYRQNVIDDGYTFFEAKPVTERSEKYRGDISKGWTMTAHLRAFGTYPKSSGFNVVVSKGGKPLSKMFCEGETYRRSEDQDPRTRNSPDDDYLMTAPSYGCYDEKKFVAGVGTFDVQVSSVNGDTDEEEVLRTYKIEVKEAKKIRPGNIPGVTDYFIQRHAEASASILYLRPSTASGGVKHGYQNINGGSYLKGNVDIFFNVAITNSAINFSGVPSVRCSVNGERVKFENDGQVKEASVRGDTVKWERDGKAPQFLGFYQYWINLPIVWNGQGQSGNPDMTRKTGNWECELRNKNEIIRKFKWTVASNGFPVEHAEQASGNMNLHWGAYLIETEFPSDENSIGERLMPMPNAGLFYGVQWKSDEGKRMAANVPKVGEPYFVQ
ncbi:MAG: hypothetical protein WBO10_10115 [Pyrinomonadaceae bacterium]